MEAVKQKVCSLHFKPDDFEFIVLGKKRAALLNTAIPPIFPFPYDDELHGVAANGSAKRIFCPFFGDHYARASAVLINK
jgi:hypothetical protein